MSTGRTEVWRRALEQAERIDALAPQARGEALRALEQSDAEMAAKVRTLLADRPDDDGMAPGFPAPALDAAILSVADLAGQVWGPYRFERVIGRGGMGEVWLARRIDGRFDGQVAVKLIGAGTHPTLAERFRREGQLLGRLSHPRIARLLDAGALPDGRLCLVLEYVDGERIDRWCDARRQTVEQRITLFRQVCDAVAHAHANLVVHRDLKPSNILVDAEGRVKLLDFGIAKLLDDGVAAAESPLTQLGGRAMTPEYASPEQVRGAPVTTATDVYALGVILYALLSGEHPYAAPNPADLLRAIVETDPSPLGSLDTQGGAAQRGTTPALLRRRLRGDLETIVAKALKKDPAERYPSAQALSEDLRRVLEHEPIQARADSPAYLLRKLLRRHRLGAAAAAAVLLAVLGGSAAALWQAAQARQQAALARAEADKAGAIRDFMVGVFNQSGVGDGDVAARQSTTALQLLQAASQRAIDDHRSPAAVRLDMLSLLGGLTSNLGMVELARRLKQAAVPLALQVHGEGSREHVHALVEHGFGLRAAGRTEDYRQALADAVALMERHGTTHLESYPEALRFQGIDRHVAGDLAGAATLLQRALQAYALHHPRHSGRAAAARWMGINEGNAGRFDAAEHHLREALALAQQLDAFGPVRQAEAAQSLADLYLRMGRYRDAAAQLEQAAELAAKALGPEHAVTGIAWMHQGRARHQLGDAAGGWALLARAEAIGRQDEARYPGRLADRAAYTRSQMAVDEGDAAAALEAAQAALAPVRPTAGPLLAAALVPQAEALLLLGRNDEAEHAAAEAARIYLARMPGTLAARHALVVHGEALERQGRHEAAMAAYQAAATAPDEAQRTLPQSRWLQARALAGRARLALPGDAAGALALARQASGLIPAENPVLRERIVHAQARQVEALALKAQGDQAAARATAAQAVALLRPGQVPGSPRLAQARQEVAALGP